VFGALSKDQTRFVHYDISQNIILNSPKLLNIIGKNNVQHGKLFLKNSMQEITSSIQPISSFSGIVSNITGYTFSEMFDMKDPKFFVQLDGSTRNIINSLGTIDSTVSTKEHILYKLYKAFMSGSDQLLYFSHRAAPNAVQEEYWHPHMDNQQLKSFRYRYPPAEFDRYFRNSWELDSGKLFSEALVKSVFYYGYINDKGNEELDDGGVLKICNEISETYAKSKAKDKRSNPQARRRRKHTTVKDLERTKKKLGILEGKLLPTDYLYELNRSTMPVCATIDDLNKLTAKYNTYWSIHAGIDRSDPMAKNPSARTIVTAIAKGLTDSRTAHNIGSESEVPEYLYFLIHLAHVEDATLEGIKRELKTVYNEFDGIDTLCSERWGAWDLAPWCEEHDIQFEAVHPSFDLQKKAFSELFVAVRNGRFKSPAIYVSGVNKSNILWEELEMFDYDPQKKWYGSPQKNERFGVQDDAVFSLGWGLYGSREHGVESFRERQANSFFGVYVPNKRNHADYREVGNG
jgi:hypothetical protein